MNAIDILQEKFDKIFILNLCTRPDRKTAILNQLKNIGYDENNIKYKDFIEFVYASPWPYNDKICYLFNTIFKTNIFKSANEYDCLRNHCHIMQIALSRGYKHILILEDDIRFADNDIFLKYISEIPDNYSIIKFDGFTSNKDVMNIIQKYRDDNIMYIKDNKDIKLWNLGCYAISNKGIDIYLSLIFKLILVADYPTYEHSVFADFYNCSYPLAIQAHDETKSDIQSDKHQTDIKKYDLYNKDIPWKFYNYNVEKSNL